MIQAFSDYEAPPVEAHRQTVVSIESDHGSITLRPSRFGYGYKLAENSEGLGQGDVENEFTPVLGGRGAVLGNQRELEGEMYLAVIISSTSNTDVKRLVSQLGQVLKPADGTVKVIATDPLTGAGRFREVAYKDGLKSPRWSGPTIVKYGITLEYEDPWAFSLPQSVPLNAVASAFEGGLVAPLIAPLVASGTSMPSAVAVDNHGSEPAPIMVTFYGPSTNPRAWAGPISVQYRGSLAWDEWVSINGMDHSVLLGGGGRTAPVPVPGRLSPHTLLSELTVPVGRTEWWYEAVDQTAQSRAEFTWWDAHRTMQ